MVTDVLPRDAGIPDIQYLVVSTPSGGPLRPDDGGRILRVLLREQIWHAQFMSLCGVGYLRDAVTQRMPRGLQLESRILYCPEQIGWRDLGLEIDLPRNGYRRSFARFFITVSMRPACGTVMILEAVPPLPSNRVRLRHLSEPDFFEAMAARGIEALSALRLVYNTLWAAAIAEDRVEPTATRLAAISALLTDVLQKKGLTW